MRRLTAADPATARGSRLKRIDEAAPRAVEGSGTGKVGGALAKVGGGVGKLANPLALVLGPVQNAL